MSSFRKILKSNISLLDLSINGFLFGLHHVLGGWKVKGVNRNNILFLCVKVLSYFFLSIVLRVPSITNIFWVLFESTKKYSFMVVHNFTEKYWCEELRMVGEHDLFLNTSRTKCTSSNVLIGEVDFYMASEILNWRLIRPQFIWHHFLIFVLLKYVLNILWQVLSLDCKILLMIFPLLIKEMVSKVCKYSIGLVLLIWEYFCKVVGIGKLPSFKKRSLLLVVVLWRD